MDTDFTVFKVNPMAIQSKIRKCLSTITRQKIKITGGSRTDSGVHAEHQVCMFKSDVALILKSVRALNALLPDNIRVFKLAAVDDSFHTHLASVGKIYRYRLWRGFTSSFCKAVSLGSQA